MKVMVRTGISPKWRKLAKNVLGVAIGRHCHWCKYMVSNDGEVTCGNPKSPFAADGDRIRTWDGVECAKQCRVFELNEWYKSDENYDKTFSGKP